ncbi:ABC transporter substrate-binding protein [Streptococcus uberis]|nr:ABC transporter substrate-binding protein [Streptococcus uberis]
MSKPEQVESWTLMSPMGAQPVNKNVVESSTYRENKTVKAYGDLSTQIAGAFDKIQVFGLVGDKNFKSMGSITSSGAVGKAVYNVTVKNGDVEEALKEAQKAAESAE